MTTLMADTVINTSMARTTIVEQMHLWSRYDSRIEVQRKRYNELLLAYQELYPQVIMCNDEKLTWYYNTLEKYFKVMCSHLAHYQTDPLKRICNINWELEEARSTVVVVESTSLHIESQLNKLQNTEVGSDR